jgi:hypothetical protein
MRRFESKSPTLYERLADEKKRIEAALILLGPGSIRNKLLGKLRQLDVAAQMDRWLSSPGLRAPV